MLPNLNFNCAVRRKSPAAKTAERSGAALAVRVNLHCSAQLCVSYEEIETDFISSSENFSIWTNTVSGSVGESSILRLLLVSVHSELFELHHQSRPDFVPQLYKSYSPII